jgi:hypothetical protein
VMQRLCMLGMTSRWAFGTSNKHDT